VDEAALLPLKLATGEDNRRAVLEAAERFQAGPVLGTERVGFGPVAITVQRRLDRWL
jgi:hypothetical protein